MFHLSLPSSDNLDKRNSEQQKENRKGVIWKDDVLKRFCSKSKYIVIDFIY